MPGVVRFTWAIHLAAVILNRVALVCRSTILRETTEDEQVKTRQAGRFGGQGSVKSWARSPAICVCLSPCSMRRTVSVYYRRIISYRARFGRDRHRPRTLFPFAALRHLIGHVVVVRNKDVQHGFGRERETFKRTDYKQGSPATSICLLQR
eukprot:1110712-Prorocentrum_minimum.AAC.2